MEQARSGRYYYREEFEGAPLPWGLLAKILIAANCLIFLAFIIGTSYGVESGRKIERLEHDLSCLPVISP